MKKNDTYIDLARQSIDNFIINGTVIDVPQNLPEKFYKIKAGVFVSLHHIITGELLGCIGTYLPAQKNICLEIINNAISAATADPRFLGLSKKDLPNLAISVDILSPLEIVKNQNELDPKKYGIYIKTSDQRSALLLPNLPGVNTLSEQLSITRQKGGIKQNEPITIYRFTVERHE